MTGTTKSGRIVGCCWMTGAAILVMLLAAAAGANPDSATTAAVLAVVNDDTITTADLDRELVKVHSTQTTTERSQFDYRNLLEKLIHDKLIIQEAYALGMNEEQWLADLLGEYRKDNAIRYFVADDFRPDLTVDNEAILQRFLLNYDRMQIRTVAVSDSADAARLAQAVTAGADMDSLARKVSLDVNSIRGGLHTEKYQADIESVYWTRAEKLQVGEVSKPFRYRNAYAFLRLESATPADTAELERFQPVIERGLVRIKQQRQWDEFVASLASKYPTTIDTAAIESILADSATLFTPNFVNDSPTPVLTIGEFALTEGKLRTETARTAMNMGDQSLRSIVATALNQSEERLILLSAARDKGYFDDERVAERYHQSLDSAMIEIYIKETVVSQIKFNWEEFEEYYDDNIDDFRNDTRYQFERIMVADSATVDELTARLADGADFDFLAKQYDPNPERESQANDWVPLASFPSTIRDDIARLEIGQHTRAFPVSEGYMFLRLRDRQLGDPKPIKDVEMKIREVMFQRKFNEQLDNALRVLKANSRIEYRQENIDNYFGSDS